MHLILDTNVFVADFWMQRTPFALLRDSLKRISGTLVVPAVVVDEVEAKYRDKLDEAVRDTERAARTLRELRGPSAGAPSGQEDLKAQHEAYSTFLRGELTRLGAEIAPLPKVSHGDVLKRALLKRPPFDKHGHGGYRDVLIWETVLELTREPRLVCLVSMDTDFGTKDGLHAELIEDLDEFARTRFEFFTSLAGFNEKWITPSLARLDQLVANFNKGDELSKRVLREAIEDLFGWDDEIMAEAAFGVPFEGLSAYVPQDEVKVSGITATDARQLGNHTIVLKGTYSFTVPISVSAHGNRTVSPEAMREFDLRPGDDCSIDFPTPEAFTIAFAVKLAGPTTDQLAITAIETLSVKGRESTFEF